MNQQKSPQIRVNLMKSIIWMIMQTIDFIALSSLAKFSSSKSYFLFSIIRLVVQLSFSGTRFSDVLYPRVNTMPVHYGTVVYIDFTEALPAPWQPASKMCSYFHDVSLDLLSSRHFYPNKVQDWSNQLKYC